MKMHSVPDRFIVQLPKDMSLEDCGIKQGPGALSTTDKGRYTVKDLDATQRKAVEKAGGRIFENRPMSIPEPATLRKLGAAVSNISRQTVNTRATHGADALHSRGIRGQGTDLVVVDSGVAAHPDYEDRIEGFFDVFANAEVPPVDGRTGHGTHVTGIGGADGTVRGMAPGAAILGIRVLDDQGRGSTASVLAGLDKALEYFQARGRPMVVNMSLGGPAGPAETDPLHDKITELKEAGILVIAAAGNEGPGPGTISSPGNSDDAVAVAAFDTKGTPEQDDDTVARFSSRGERTDDGTGQTGKPDIGANGVEVVSTFLDDGFAALSGTSMASPAVAGAAALLLGRANDLFNNGKLTKSPFDLVKDGDIQKILVDSAFDNPDIPDTSEGAGNLRADRAEALLVERFGCERPDPCMDEARAQGPMNIIGTLNINLGGSGRGRRR